MPHDGTPEGGRYALSMVKALLCPLAVAWLGLVGGCGEAAMTVGVHTRSAIYAQSVLEHDGGARAIITAHPPRVGTLQGIAPSAPMRGLGAFASDGIRVALRRACAESTVLTGPNTIALIARGGASGDLQQLLKEAQDSGILDPQLLAKIGKVAGLDYFFLGTMSLVNSSNSTRFSPLGLTMVRSDWTTLNMVLQLYHAPTGRIVWQSLGDCTDYAESAAAIPVSVHVVSSDLCEAMIKDLLWGRSRTTLMGTGNEPEHRAYEPTVLQQGKSAPDSTVGEDDGVPANEAEVMPELPLGPAAVSPPL